MWILFPRAHVRVLVERKLLWVLSKNQVIFHRGDRRVRRVLRRFQSLFKFSGCR